MDGSSGRRWNSSAPGRWSVDRLALLPALATSRPALATVPIMARTAGLLFLAGGLLAIVSLASATWPDAGGLMFGMAATAAVIGAGITRWGRYLPRWAYQILVQLGTLLITAMVYLADGGADSWGYGCVYLFIAVDAFFFFAWPVALAHLALMELCSVIAFSAVRMPLPAFILQQGCIVVVAIVVGWLARAASAAEVDQLTGLSNLRGFRRAMNEAISATDRTAGQLAIISIDFDDFKALNDSNGDAHGDRVLRTAARTWAPLLVPGQIMARPGGDEFAFVLPGYSAAQAAVLADQLRSAVAAQVSCSAGVAEFRSNDSSSMLINRSEVALYEAKSTGRGQTAQYGVVSHDCTEIHAGLAAGQFRVFYQPIIDFQSGQECGDEALVRWQHPVRGLVPPDEFIPEAERTGAIHAIGAWVLRQACEHAASGFWRTGRKREVAVNVSGRELRSPEYAESVAALLERTGLDPRQLTIEITETTLDADRPQVATTVRQLREQGITIAIDDFGTGYSNLTRLSRVTVDILKIDKSFVDDIPEDGGDVPILMAIVALANALHLKTVAEGIETPNQALVLKRIGCTYAQGYLYGRPQPPPTHEYPHVSSRLSPPVESATAAP